MESTLTYLFAGYTSIWIVFFAYILRLRRRERELHQELELLRDQLAEERHPADL
jgi:CcmD family protein